MHLQNHNQESLLVYFVYKTFIYISMNFPAFQLYFLKSYCSISIYSDIYIHIYIYLNLKTFCLFFGEHTRMSSMHIQLKITDELYPCAVHVYHVLEIKDFAITVIWPPHVHTCILHCSNISKRLTPSLIHFFILFIYLS